MFELEIRARMSISGAMETSLSPSSCSRAERVAEVVHACQRNLREGVACCSETTTYAASEVDFGQRQTGRAKMQG